MLYVDIHACIHIVFMQYEYIPNLDIDGPITLHFSMITFHTIEALKNFVLNVFVPNSLTYVVNH